MAEDKTKKEFVGEPYFAVLSALSHLMADAGINYAIIGGIAAGMWGMPRSTYDVDIVATLDKGAVKQLLDTAGKHGFTFKTDEIKTLLKSDMLRIYYQPGGQEIIIAIDCMLAETEYQREVIRRAKKIKISDYYISFASPEDVIILKLISFRGKDRADIDDIIRYRGRSLDTGYIMKWAKVFEVEANLRNCRKIIQTHKIT
ncbi:hypothetical protein COY52_03100 [Candidatus Desantisbacteria bacterium CG_4_10_14_0_8_um_filter_48_22]|uniref:Nucleotidyl transferase AbiEii/AbiGii toxin family protein n=1 Tax=Candidatus Desantisbacteria bacterium CG_4_10_14_0_8_um_filter_48_22 TaxID=1974543 RepID=A0A2M7SE00_9BACT|nr:MAG: hypothetical protein AUJ67_09150 [Candidatus Desantisbacteria bacterium CG1_02_49_89]PIV54918.1 MAG: hypothetical protein COS16_08830 [Candidatus Desantisbacteria bacterium CG02_land_8_20_14_3_00_49_13]PIZ17719.1 MAG: hypothetical protein COY52_03100 [Candidatus Desantisbacteria bacterium CG_4_10_14_0_8_um_filter_48_22]PJB28780.1 MAG: hypothetical protein CO111_00720 [Candidatus Desantisbacteria bacterium CG_4_9_14_3_um_filter_50_7]